MGFHYVGQPIKTMIDRLAMAIVWALPRWIVKWSLVRATAHGTMGKHSGQVVPELTCMTALERWGKA